MNSNPFGNVIEHMLGRSAQSLSSLPSGTQAAAIILRSRTRHAIGLGSGALQVEKLMSEFEHNATRILRPGDYLLRVGCADYLFMVHNISTVGQPLLAANRLRNLAAESRGENGASIDLIAGVALSEAGESAESLVSRAASALQQAQETTTPVMVASVSVPCEDGEIAELSGPLQRAIESGEIECAYQPKVDLKTELISSYEVLARWNPPGLAAVSPARFIAVAEATGMIQQLTWSIINSALDHLASCRADRRPGVAFNVSPLLLRDPNFFDQLMRSLSIWNVAAEHITLEITESIVMDGRSETLDLLKQLRQSKLRISVDDFGTGFSSLSYFCTLPMDELKIDQSFVRSLTESTTEYHIVQSVIDLGHRLGLSVVAEGVETQEIHRLLQSMGCDVGQGYLYGKPSSQLRAGSQARIAVGATD